MIGTDSIADRPETIGAQPRGELELDAANQRRAVKYQRGIKLHQRRAGADLGVRIGAA